MENFFNLRAEKQEHIINAALTVFGRNGYKKASIADIAEQAGIAKGMVMYYFGSKKNLYLYLMELGRKVTLEEMEKVFEAGVIDFFEKLRMATNIKVAMIKKYPAIIQFLTSVFYETNGEVADEVKKFLDTGMELRQEKVINETDISRFKSDIDTKLLDRFFVWASEGFSNHLILDENLDKIDLFVEDFLKLLDLMEKYFYED